MKLKIDGIEREYREVKRKASPGELIKITYDGFGSGACDGDYFKVGNIARVKIMGDDDVIADFKGLGNAYVYNSGTWHVNHSAYVVLEPVETEIDSLVSELSRRIDEIIEEVSDLKAQIQALFNVKNRP
ncbi:hypothetical protein PACILC2_22490 [Paenibacillus cisolokensis]|uniref:Uncharacterized protein n=1 Tax=Paenibacillus cisolokensis TaxID=1658519 RepID=A0ABQ4N6A1_9BACL|nr:hypothetical protein [Paenibacillus cisolokensis]GIQ63681.1 hypothetical protein PACILC2_22490 [Paenibacillus cisolokensis]